MDRKQKSENVTGSLDGNILSVAIRGEIDHHTAKSLRGKIDEKMYAARPKTVLLDVGEVTFMDSSGLGLLLGRFTVARELGSEFRIVSPSDSVKKILDLAGADKLITIEENQNSVRKERSQK